jgi:hypothetical protein
MSQSATKGRSAKHSGVNVYAEQLSAVPDLRRRVLRRSRDLAQATGHRGRVAAGAEPVPFDQSSVPSPERLLIERR